MDFLKDFVQSFIPRAENDYKPYFFRARAVLILVALILALGAVAFTLQNLIIKNNSYLAAVIASVLVDFANNDRTQNGLQDLAVNPTLEVAAQLKADDMARKGYFAHTSPEGVTPWFWFQEAGYQFAYAGENLAVRFSDSADVNQAWMNSPTHRANILGQQFTEIGIATAQGTYQGQNVIFVVQEFGRPAAAIQPPVVISTTTPAMATTTPVVSPTVAGTSTPLKESKPSAAATNATNSPAEVAGTSAERALPRVILENDNFIAVQSVPATNSPLTAAVSGPFDSFTSFFEKVLTSPRTLMNLVYVVLAGIILIALTLMIFLEVRRQHPLNVLYGIGLLLLIIAFIYVGQVYVGGALAIL
ncbi:MAG: CAP domain-containing protein [bacterium]|nr:CAP domain-containing protein [bacterium]